MYVGLRSYLKVVRSLLTSSAASGDWLPADACMVKKKNAAVAPAIVATLPSLTSFACAIYIYNEQC